MDTIHPSITAEDRSLAALFAEAFGLVQRVNARLGQRHGQPLPPARPARAVLDDQRANQLAQRDAE